MDRLDNRLSERLTALCGMVKRGSRVADVGCDHGFVPIYLVQKGICPHVLAMDVRMGPLSRAEEHIRECGLDEYIDTRLSDGLNRYVRGEADTLVCAGMGGKLMLRILTEAGDKTEDFSELILQPQSDLFEFRSSLRMNGYEITDEKMIFEGGKYYFLMKAMHARNVRENPGNVREKDGDAANFEIPMVELYDRYGEWNIRRKSPLLEQFLAESLKAKNKLAQALLQNGGARATRRLVGLQYEIACIRAALNLLNRHIY